MKVFFRNILVIGIVALTLQTIWEYSVANIFYVTNYSFIDKQLLMMSAIFGDMVMSLVLYIILSYVNMDINWIFRKFDRNDYIITILYSLFLSFYFEISSLYRNRWGYSNMMPFFYNTNIGLVPVIQLLILLPTIFYISRVILIKLEENSNKKELY